MCVKVISLLDKHAVNRAAADGSFNICLKYSDTLMHVFLHVIPSFELLKLGP